MAPAKPPRTDAAEARTHADDASKRPRESAPSPALALMAGPPCTVPPKRGQLNPLTAFGADSRYNTRIHNAG